MAIEKTVFTGTTQTANAPEVYAFLNANKSGYFDSVTMDETTGNVICTLNGVNVLTLGFDGSTKSIVVRLLNGTASSAYDTSVIWKYGIKTSNGLCIYRGSALPSVFITKTNEDTLAIVYRAKTATSTVGSDDFLAFDIEHGTSAFEIHNSISSTFPTAAAWSTGLTAFVPYPLSESYESYAPNLFITPFTQYKGIVSKLTANGKEYFYNGYIALAD